MQQNFETQVHTHAAHLNQEMIRRVDSAEGRNRLTEGEAAQARVLIHTVPLELNSRLRRTAGRAHSAGRTFIELSTAIVRDNGIETVMARTYPHEMAHIVANKIQGQRCGHNHAWRRWCAILQDVPFASVTRCHSYHTKRNKAQGPATRQVFPCPQCGENIRVGPRQAVTILRGARGYRARCCKTEITAAMVSSI